MFAHSELLGLFFFFDFLQITHPAGCMSQFIQFFGEQIMVLWKFALLRKRLLIFSPPPVGVVCYRGEMHTNIHT